MILQALLEGGWSQEKEDSEPEEVQRDDPDFEPSENALVQSILAGSGANDENETAVDVQSALNSQTEEDAKANKVEKLVEELDQDLEIGESDE